jgi:hypothetical protein
MNSGIPLNGYADGGRPPTNKVSLVGERGPELFVPDTAGTIIPNEVAFNDSRAAMQEGATTRMASASADNDEAMVMASAFADSNKAMMMATAARNSNAQSATSKQAVTAVEQHISSGESTVSFETYRVGEMDVVTREEAVRIGQQSAKQAEANVYRGMRNMPAVRTRAGIK